MKTSAPQRIPLSKMTGRRRAGVAHRRHDAGQRVERGHRPVDLSTAVVGDVDAVDAGVDGAPGVVGVQDPLEHDGQARQLAQPRQVVPRQRRAAEDLEEGLDGGARLLRGEVVAGAARVVAAHRQQGADGRGRGPRARGVPPLRPSAAAAHPLGDAPLEDGVGRVLGDPLAAGEGQVPEVEVAGTPAEVCRVERDDERLAAARLGPGDEARDEVVVAAPVELVPVARSRRSAVAISSIGTEAWVLMIWVTCCCARPTGDGEVGLVVRHRQHADRCDEQRALVPTAEELDAGVARGRVDEHAGHHLPPVEGGDVGAAVASEPAEPAT